MADLLQREMGRKEYVIVPINGIGHHNIWAKDIRLEDFESSQPITPIRKLVDGEM